MSAWGDAFVQEIREVIAALENSTDLEDIQFRERVRIAVEHYERAEKVAPSESRESDG